MAEEEVSLSDGEISDDEAEATVGVARFRNL